MNVINSMPKQDLISDIQQGKNKGIPWIDFLQKNSPYKFPSQNINSEAI
jgi:hypothetical protein